jgi:hypothetical protein
MKDSFLYIYVKLITPVIGRTIFKIVVYLTFFLLGMLIIVAPGYFLMMYSPGKIWSFIFAISVVFSIPAIVDIIYERKKWGYGIDEHMVFSGKNFKRGLKAIVLLFVFYLFSIREGDEYFFKYVLSLFAFAEAGIIVSFNRHNAIGSNNIDKNDG